MRPFSRRAFVQAAAGALGCCLARPALGDEPAAPIDALFAAYDKPDSPGCALTVLHRGRVVHQRGYGRAHLEWDAPITPSTVFHTASLAKQFTALAVCLLAEQGKLSLDDDVRKYLPELPDHGTAVTLRHLLQHTSGLHDAAEVLGLAGWRPDDLVTDRDFLNLAVRQKALDFRPGDRHVYGNTGYVLAGLVVRRVSGRSLRAYAEEHIFRPLGMTNTHFHDNHAEVVRHRASAYSWHGGRPEIAVPTFDSVGSTGLFTTAEDLARWDQNFHDRRVGGKSALDQMLTPGKLNNGEPIRYGRDLGYGLGLVIGHYRGLKTVSHSGGDRGYRAEYLRFPEQRFAVIILGNVDTLQAYFLARRVADVCLGKEFPEGPEHGARRPGATAGAVQLSERELAAWVGTYWNLSTGASWRVTVKNGTLRAGAARLTPRAPDRFVIGDYPIDVIFTPARDGAPRKLTWVDLDPEVFEAVPELHLAKAQEEAYAGRYRSEELNAEYTVSVRDGELVVRGWRDEYGPLRPVVADGFSFSPPQLPTAFVRFTRGGDPAVTGFTLSTERCRAIPFVRADRPRAGG